MKEIVWVFGVSAVGKDTFCHYISEIIEPKKLSDLGFMTGKVVTSNISIRSTGKFVGDPIIHNRLDIPKEVKELLKTHSTVLIKWQFTDMSLGVFEQVESENPDANIRIVLLQSDDSAVASRLLEKEWWNNNHQNEDPLHNVISEKSLVNSSMLKLKDKYPITFIKSDPNYNFILCSTE